MEIHLLIFFFFLFGGAAAVQQMYVRWLEHRERLQAENAGLREEVRGLENRCRDLEERVGVLETIVTDEDFELERQFRRLESAEPPEKVRLKGN